MIDFNTADIKKLTARDRLFRRITLPITAAIIVIGVIAATLFASGNEKYVTAYLVLLTIDLLLIAGFAIFIIVIKIPNTAKLKNAVKHIIYADLAAHNEIFADEEVMLTVEFSQHVLTISSQNGTRQFDLKSIKNVPTVYSSCGNMLYDYIIAYCQVACERGFKGNVTCLDKTSRRAVTFDIVKDGVPSNQIKDAQKILEYGKGAEK